MKLLIGIIVVAVAIGYLVGGRLRRVESLRLRWWGLAILGLAMQLFPIPVHHHLGHLINEALLIASYPVLITFAVANFRLAGFPLIVGGLIMNGIVISANGTMPVSRSALVSSGQADALKSGLGSKHHLIQPDDTLTQLADVIPVGDPVNAVFSAGDVLVYGGVGWLIVAAMRGRPDLVAPRRWRRKAERARS